MKKIVAMICCVFVCALLLSACFESTVYPDMVEYSQAQVLQVAKEKYGIRSFIFTDKQFHGVTNYDADGFSVMPFTREFSADFVNGDNIETAFTSFAGKNGGHDIQGMYAYFLCYAALGIDADGQAKFVYYNLNLDKNAEIADTIGCSDYPFDILPTEITNALLTAPQNWGAMSVYLNKHFKNIGNALRFSGDRLAYGYSESARQYVSIEFYRENGRIVYDLLYFEDVETDAEPHLVYSTSDRYGVIYMYYGLDKSEYVDVEYTVSQSEEDPALDLLAGTVKLKPVEGTIVYSELTLGASYKVLSRDGTVATYEDRTRYRFATEAKGGFLMDRIDGVDHRESAKIECTHIYILYEKAV